MARTAAPIAVPPSPELRDALNEFGWTHKEAARRLGVHPNTVHRWCAGPDRAGGLAVPGPVLAYIRLRRAIVRRMERL